MGPCCEAPAYPKPAEETKEDPLLLIDGFRLKERDESLRSRTTSAYGGRSNERPVKDLVTASSQGLDQLSIG